MFHKLFTPIFRSFDDQHYLKRYPLTSNLEIKQGVRLGAYTNNHALCGYFPIYLKDWSPETAQEYRDREAQNVYDQILSTFEQEFSQRLLELVKVTGNDPCTLRNTYEWDKGVFGIDAYRKRAWYGAKEVYASTLVILDEQTGCLRSMFPDYGYLLFNEGTFILNVRSFKETFFTIDPKPEVEGYMIEHGFYNYPVMPDKMGRVQVEMEVGLEIAKPWQFYYGTV